MTRAEAIAKITTSLPRLSDEHLQVLADIAQSWSGGATEHARGAMRRRRRIANGDPRKGGAATLHPTQRLPQRTPRFLENRPCKMRVRYTRHALADLWRSLMTSESAILLRQRRRKPPFADHHRPAWQYSPGWAVDAPWIGQTFDTLGMSARWPCTAYYRIEIEERLDRPYSRRQATASGADRFGVEFTRQPRQLRPRLRQRGRL